MSLGRDRTCGGSILKSLSLNTHNQPLDVKSVKVIDTIESHNYTYLKKIASGGFATVHLAHHSTYGMDFAVKQISKGSLEFNEQEIESLIQLIHPGIIKIYDHFNDDENLYLVLEYCPNGSIDDLVMKFGKLSGIFLYEMCYQISLALLYCHENGVVHLDIKPANIFIDKYGNAKIGDFGVSQITKGSREKVNNFNGSRCFQSPQIIAREPFNPMKADVWALGCTFFFMATGELPFFSKSEESLELMIQNRMFKIPAGVDSNFAAIISGMLASSEHGRPSMKTVMEAMKSLGGEHDSQSLSRSFGKTHNKIPKDLQAKLGISTGSGRRSSIANCAGITILKPAFVGPRKSIKAISSEKLVDLNLTHLIL